MLQKVLENSQGVECWSVVRTVDIVNTHFANDIDKGMKPLAQSTLRGWAKANEIPCEWHPVTKQPYFDPQKVITYLSRVDPLTGMPLRKVCWRKTEAVDYIINSDPHTQGNGLDIEPTPQPQPTGVEAELIVGFTGLPRPQPTPQPQPVSQESTSTVESANTEKSTTSWEEIGKFLGIFPDKSSAQTTWEDYEEDYEEDCENEEGYEEDYGETKNAEGGAEKVAEEPSAASQKRLEELLRQTTNWDVPECIQRFTTSATQVAKILLTHDVKVQQLTLQVQHLEQIVKSLLIKFRQSRLSHTAQQVERSKAPKEVHTAQTDRQVFQKEGDAYAKRALMNLWMALPFAEKTPENKVKMAITVWRAFGRMASLIFGFDVEKARIVRGMTKKNTHWDVLCPNELPRAIKLLRCMAESGTVAPWRDEQKQAQWLTDCGFTRESDLNFI
jgi:hypothetical protein